uniref:KIAA1614 n=1 Tax=Oryctolagus cuniculus TaxID=9986 RepID=A0A5F9CFG9_RABIT
MSPAPDPQLPAEAPRPQARCWPCPGAPCRLRLTLGRRPSQLALPVHGARSRRPAAACLLSRSSFGIKGDREEIRSQPRGSGSPPQILLGQGPGCAGGPGPRAGSARVLPEIRSHGLVLPGWPHGDIACSAPTARAARDPQAPARPRPPIRRARPGAGPELRGAREREAGAASLLRDGGHRGGGTVERNRLLLQETLNASGPRPLQAGAAAWTLSRGRAAPERPAGDEDGDPGFSLQDSDKNGAFGLRLEPALSPWHEEAKRVLQGTRMKARTQPLRASHDIVLTNAQGSRDGQGSPTLEPRTTSSCSHSLSHASVPRPRWGPSTAHVRFEDESACEAEFRYLERLQERQRQVLSTVLQAMDQGALRSKPDLTDYIAGGLRLQDARSVGSRRKCSAWGSYAGHPCPAEGKALPNRGVPQELHADSQWGLSTPLFLSAEPGFHGGWIRETHIGSIPDPEGEDPALDSCQLRKEEVGTLWPSSTCERHHGGLEGPGRAEVELPLGFQARPHLSGAADMDVGQEEGGGGCLPEGTSFLREDAVPEPALASEGASLGSHRQPGPGLGSHQAHSAASRAPWRTGCESGSQAQTNHNSLEIVPCLSPPQSCTEPCAPHHALRPAPPSSRRTPTPPSRRRTVPAVHLPPAPSRREAVRTCEPSPPPQAQPCSPLGQYPLLAPAPNNCGSGPSGGPQEPCEGRLEERPCGWEPEPAPDSDGHDVATVHATGITISLASEPESSQEPEGALQTTRLHSTGCVLPQASPEASAAPDPASATASSRSRKRGSSLVSSLGLRKFFSTLGQSARPKLATSRSRSVEQLHPAVPATAPHSSTPGARRAPSLQALHLGSPWHQHHGAASFHSLHALLSGKGDRSSLYLVAEPGGHGVAGSTARAPPRRALSVEDVGTPSLARTVGRVVEVFPDGTSQLQLQRSPDGTFGFCVASGNGRRDSGFYVQAMADLNTAKLYSGLLGVGDEILEVNGAKVAGLGLALVEELLAHAESLSMRVLRQRPGPR